MTESDFMQDIEYNQLIITCEACGNVKRFTVASQDEYERIFRDFHCENSCGRNLYSFITLGMLHVELTAPPEDGENVEAATAPTPTAAGNGADTAETEK